MMTALVRFNITLFVRSQVFIFPLLIYCGGVTLIFIPPASPILANFGAAAALLFPVSAWIGLLMMGNEPETQRYVTAAASGSTRRMWVAKIWSIFLVIGCVALATVFFLIAINIFSGILGINEIAIALIALLAAGIPGSLIGSLCSSQFIRGTGWRWLSLMWIIVGSIPLGTTDIGKHFLPPSVKLAEVLNNNQTNEITHNLFPYLVGSTVSILITLVVLAILYRHRD